MTKNSKAETTTPSADGEHTQPMPASYAEAAEELDDLLDQLEGADVDVDLLAQQVARGVQLIRFCRARLEVVTDDVEEVVAELISVDGSDAGGNGNGVSGQTEVEDEAE